MGVYGSNFFYGQSPTYKDEGVVIITAPIESTIQTEGDIKLVVPSNLVVDADIQVDVRDLLRELGMETAVLLSLFTDQRAGVEDVVPDNSGDARGWWGDVLNTDNDADGSKLWLLFRGKISDETLTQIEEYTRAALKWMITDDIADSVTVSAARTSLTSITWSIAITRAKGGAAQYYKYFYNWQQQVYGKA